MPNKRAAAMRVLSFALVTAAFPASTRGAVRLSADSATVESCSNLQRIYRPGKPLEEYPVLPIYEMRLLRDSSVHLLRRMLKSRCWAEARELYFTNYQASIPDWVVYVDAKGKVYQDLSTEPSAWTKFLRKTGFKSRPNGAASTDRAVSGKRFLYALIVSDSDLTSSQDPSPISPPPPPSAQLSLRITSKDLVFDAPVTATAPATAAASAPPAVSSDGGSQLAFRRRVVTFQRDPVLSVLIAGLGKALGVTSPPEPLLTDSCQTISLTQSAAGPTEGLYVALGRFALIDNARIEFSVEPMPGKQFGPRRVRPMLLAGRLFAVPVGDSTRLVRVIMNLGNDRERGFEAGVVPAISWGRPIRGFGGTPIAQTSKSSRAAGSIYVAATWNAVWFSQLIGTRVQGREGWRKASLGPVIGTSVLPNIGDEFLTGFVLGHVLGDAGVTLAANWKAEPELKDEYVFNPRKPRPLVGFFLAF